METNKRSNFNPAKVQEARIGRGLSLEELAAQIQVTKQALSLIESGQSMPKAETMMSMINTLEMPRSFFYGESDDSEPVIHTFFRADSRATKKIKEMQKVRANWIYQVYRYFAQYMNFPELNLPDVSAFEQREWTPDTIEELAQHVRNHWGLEDKPIPNVINVLEKHGFIVANLVMGNQHVDAFCQTRHGRPLIILGDDKRSAVRRQFDIAHELGHLLMHRWVTDQVLSKEEDRKIEEQANLFAGAFLLPASSFGNTLRSTFTLTDYTEMKKIWRVSIGAMIVRAYKQGVLDDERYVSLQKQISARGMRAKEPLDDILPIKQPTLLNKAITLMIEKGRKSKQQIINEMTLSAKEIENICLLKPGALTEKEHETETVVYLKDFRTTKHMG